MTFRTNRRRLRRFGQIGLSAAALVAGTSAIKPAVLLFASADGLVSRTLYVLYPASHVRHPRKASGATTIRLRTAQVLATTHPEFLSVAIDASQLVGGHWWSEQAERRELGVGSVRIAPFDFERSRLIALAALLSPAFLRVGGTEADSIYYDLGDDPNKPLAHGYRLRMTRTQWDALQAFSHSAGLRLMFTINAGPGARDARGRWTGDNAAQLFRYAKAHGQEVAVWELGNEVNVHWLTQGLEHHVGAETYARDYRRFRALVAAAYPGARTAAAAAFLWPVMGEPPPKLLPELTQRLSGELDILTWHYYPQQSRRCWSATRRAASGLLLQPAMLDELNRHLDYLDGLQRRNARAAELWLGETGSAQCGGEPGVSDRHESSLWWLDQLGKAAARGQRVVVRQTLVGSDYGLLDEDTLEPRPDYWASILWKRLMGEKVLQVTDEPADEHLRAYAHCQRNHGDGAVTLLVLNTDAQRARVFALPDLDRGGAQLYRVTAASLEAKTARLGRQPLRLKANGALPRLSPEPLLRHAKTLHLPAASYAFVTFPEAKAEACVEHTALMHP